MNKLLLMFALVILIIPAVIACPNMTSNFVEGRYRDNTVGDLEVFCNGTAPTACLYSINDFANTTIGNCSNFSIASEMGWNRLNLCASNGTVWNCSAHNFWAKTLSGGSSSDYAVMIITLAVGVLLFLLGGFLKARIFMFLAGTAGIILGYEMVAFSMFAGFSVLVCSALFSLAVMFNGGKQQ